MDVVGLVLNCAGAATIFIFGLPPTLSGSGVIHLVTEQADEGEIKTAKKHKMISRIGLVLLAVGFLFQLLGKVM